MPLIKSSCSIVCKSRHNRSLAHRTRIFEGGNLSTSSPLSRWRLTVIVTRESSRLSRILCWRWYGTAQGIPYPQSGVHFIKQLKAISLGKCRIDVERFFSSQATSYFRHVLNAENNSFPWDKVRDVVKWAKKQKNRILWKTQ